MPRWLAKLLRDWHRRKAAQLAASAEEHRKAADQVKEWAVQHEHRAKHRDFIANRRRGG